MKNLREISTNWKQLCQHCEAAEQVILDLLAHPDAKPEQIAEVRAKLIEHRALQLQVWESIQKVFVGMYAQPSPPAFIMARRARQARKERAHE
jgi:hypothetical protein